MKTLLVLWDVIYPESFELCLPFRARLITSLVMQRCLTPAPETEAVVEKYAIVLPTRLCEWRRSKGRFR